MYYFSGPCYVGNRISVRFAVQFDHRVFFRVDVSSRRNGFDSWWNCNINITVNNILFWSSCLNTKNDLGHFDKLNKHNYSFSRNEQKDRFIYNFFGPQPVACSWAGRVYYIRSHPHYFFWYAYYITDETWLGHR